MNVTEILVVFIIVGVMVGGAIFIAGFFYVPDISDMCIDKIIISSF